MSAEIKTFLLFLLELSFIMIIGILYASMLLLGTGVYKIIQKIYDLIKRRHNGST